MHLFAHDIPRHLPCHRSTVNAAIWPAWAIPLQLLSGGFTARESMPQIVQNIMLREAGHRSRVRFEVAEHRGAFWKEYLSFIGMAEAGRKSRWTSRPDARKRLAK